jgi:hypothetical protein
METVGNSKGHHDGGNGAGLDILCVDDLAFALILRLIMNKAHQITIIL